MEEITDQDFHVEACRKVAGLDIYKTSSGRDVFCDIAVKYARRELQSKGVELDSIASVDESLNYCLLCLKEHPNLDPEMALTVVTHAIEWTAINILKSKTNK